MKYAISGSRVALICVLCLVSTKMSLTSTEKCDDGDTFCRAILALGCAHLLPHLRRFRSRGKSRALPLPHLRCTRLLASCFWAPRDACHISSCDTARSQLVCWHVVAGHCPLHRCRILKAKLATGATGQPHQNATPLNYGDWLPPAPFPCIAMHATGATHPLHVCCAARASTLQSFIVDSVVVVVVGPMTVRHLTRHRSGETEETPVPYHQGIGYEEVWPVIDSAPLGSSPETEELSPLHNSECIDRRPRGNLAVSQPY